jgi:D-glycero-alpha-D-manno-heptose-7-phosphate kinase
MIVSRTPYRISFVGGGSDLSAYYRRRPGAVIAMAISRYMYVAVNKRFDDSIRVSYTRTEIVDDVNRLKHDLIREAMKRTGVTRGVEITTIGDIPAGIGLASSSSLTVGVLNALYAYQGRYVTADRLAEQACEIEIDRLRKPIGKQDQYIAAFGGFQHFRFNRDETVAVNPVVCGADARARLIDDLMLFYSGIQRDSADVLTDARRQISKNGHTQIALDQLVDLVDEFMGAIASEDFARLGPLLHKGWLLKKKMSHLVSNSDLDRFYAAARRAGATGGKVAGAGGGGCLLLAVPRRSQARVRRTLTGLGLKEIPLGYEHQGSRLVYLGGDR